MEIEQFTGPIGLLRSIIKVEDTNSRQILFEEWLTKYLKLAKFQTRVTRQEVLRYKGGDLAEFNMGILRSQLGKSCAAEAQVVTHSENDGSLTYEAQLVIIIVPEDQSP